MSLIQKAEKKMYQDKSDYYLMIQNQLKSDNNLGQPEQSVIEGKDIITQLLNKNTFLHRAAMKLQRAEQEKDDLEYHIIFFNLCNFKLYNIKNGPTKGDFVLKEFAEKLQEYFPGDLISRFADDHFVVFSKRENIVDLIREIHDEFTLSYIKNSLDMKAGVYIIRSQEESIVLASDLAKIACDSIRDSMGTICCFYEHKMSAQIEIEEYVIRHIDEALEKEYIQVCYQPIIRTINQGVCGFEALSRWYDPIYGKLSPSQFISTLEKSGQIQKLDLYIMEQVCKEIHKKDRFKRGVVPISFNLSRLDFINCDIFREVENIIKKYDVSRNMICIEITESTVVKDTELVGDTMRRFRKAGYQVWMDDFGSEYSSLNLLKDYEFDEIKLDMNFLSNFNDRSKEIVRSMIQMAKKIGIRTLAEGVETKEQFDFLRSIGCEKVQGTYFGSPLPLVDAVSNCDQKELFVETEEWRSYFDRIGRVNFITDRALALFEYSDDTFSNLFMNDVYWNELEKSGAITVEEALKNMNRHSSELADFFRKAVQEGMNDNEMRELNYMIRGENLRVYFKKVASYQDHVVFQAEVFNAAKIRENMTEEIPVAELSMVESVKAEELWKNLYNSSAAYLFWKNTDHQFMGVNQNFMNYYGIKDETEIIGKTDEQMHWHINDIPFHDDENDVLLRGETVRYRPGKCIMRGIVRNIVATKVPIYRDGKIIGLIGYFIDVDELLKSSEPFQKEPPIDQVTNLLNARGILDTVMDYVDRWNVRKEKFALLRIEISNYQKQVYTYGQKTAETFLKEISSRLLDIVKTTASCGHIYNGTFVVCLKYGEKDEIQKLAERVEINLRSIRQIAGCAVTLEPQISVCCVDEARDFHELVGYIL